jgi:hypothetical protein
VCQKKKRIHPKGGPIGSIEVGIGSNQWRPLIMIKV